MLNAIGVNKCGGIVGPVDTHSPILPVDLMKFSENIRLFPALTEHIWIYLNISEYIWIYLNLSEYIWKYLNLSEHIWNYLNTSEIIWIYLKLFWWFSETIWNYLKLSEKIRHCVKLGNSALHKIRQFHNKIYTLYRILFCSGDGALSDPAVKIAQKTYNFK